MQRFLVRKYGRARGMMTYRALIPFTVGFIIALLVVLAILKSTQSHVQMAWLTVVYYPTPGAMLPKIKMYRLEYDMCELQAKKLYSNFYALRTQAFCLGV